MTADSSEAKHAGADGRSAAGAWLTLVAPGMLIPRGLLSLAFVVAPWLTDSLRIAFVARVAAALVFLGQLVSTVAMVRWPTRRNLAAFVAFLAVDALLCGVVLGSERQLWGVGLLMAVVALAVSFEVDGWRSVGTAAALVVVGFAAARLLDVRTPLVWPDTWLFGTTLSVETGFAGTLVRDAAVRWFPTLLLVETSFAGASGPSWTAASVLPAAALGFAAVGFGAAVSAARARRLGGAAAGNSGGRRGRAAVIGLLLVLASVSTATAQCDPSGRAVFVRGLDALSHGSLPEATRIFFQLVQTQPACPEARNNLAVLLVEQDRLDEAATQLHEALRSNPDYARARTNLARVDALIQERRGPGAVITASALATPSTTSAPTAATPTPTPAESAAAGAPAGGPATAQTEAPPVTDTTTPIPSEATATRTPEPQGRRPASPSPGVKAVEVRPAAACAIEPAHNRICVYQLGEAALVAEECYAITLAQVRGWPRSVVASEVTAQHIRLLDETGQTRLEIVPEEAKVSGDVLRLRQADLQALAARVVPWRTAWLVVE